MSDWHHAPTHRFGGANTFFITAGTHLKQHIFREPSSLDSLRDTLFAQAEQHACELQAWALFANHYHLVVRCDNGESLRKMISRLHTVSAIDINRRDGVQGRRVWYQYWDKTLTFEGSWLARLKYTHENAVHHGLVRNATQYPWCSAAWFERSAASSFVMAVRRMKIDSVKVYDEFG